MSKLVTDNFEPSDINRHGHGLGHRQKMVTLNLAQKYQEGKYGKILKRFRVGHIQDDK